ncbi:hypothetical protein Ccrd_002511 [Cynara cardunculus var. scolymus]|uniref:Tryptophan synthase beta chain-like PALP domain-containing protein n=1 Tax=Cynara cardunculus var. scolymus TaxID=59895 RepID=A0A124SD01_CYNCS|nr:hypothetical protein Ccrd_002511 [Cynara cardunculus var. scolymus]
MEDKSQKEHHKYAADIDSISKAQTLIRPYVNITPVLSSETLNLIAGKSLFFKCECFQKGGAFKFRGASNAIFSLNDEQAAKGVVTHSSGNHAAALALAAKLRGIPAYIVIPKNAPKCKVENVKRYGGQVIWSEANMQSREETANKGTLSLEFLDQVPHLDTLIVPISGGGLISGVAIGAKSINPAIRVLAAEPKGADDAAQSKASDKEIVEAMRYCYEVLKVAIEPSGAIGLAAVLSDSFKRNPASKDTRNIGIVLSGGNVDLGVLWESLNNR